MNKPDVPEFKNQMSDNEKLIDMEALLSNLKKEDLRIEKMLSGLKWMYVVLVIAYSLMFIANPDPDLGWSTRISGVCYVLAFIYLAILFRKYVADQQNTDYSVPLVEMLSKAAERHGMQYRRIWALLPPLFLIDAGISLSIGFQHHFSAVEPLHRILIVQAVYIPVILVSYLAGYLIWYKRQKPIRDEALKMLKKIQEE
jgi:hypothetical protein